MTAPTDKAPASADSTGSEPTKSDFIRHIIRTDKERLGDALTVRTRFPPEPSGLPHIGHAKALGVSFTMAAEFGGTCYLRFDDTNPEKEKASYETEIQNDIKWLGYQWDGEIKHASDYFGQLYDLACQLIKDGKAYVCDLSSDEIKAQRGTTKVKGTDSPYRERSVEENLELFAQMKAGKFEEGTKVLRAKIDMAASNLILRDPVIYRIKYKAHHRTGDSWCIYPMYDFTHCLSDAIEGITHSFCSLEFENHRPVYDWFVNELDMPHKPRQIEFSRLELNYTIVGKRYLRQMVDEGIVASWGDPRLPTLRGMRNRGIPPKAIRNFTDRIGVSKNVSVIDLSILEECVREELNRSAHRVMAVLDPIKITFTNFKEDEQLTASNHPQDESFGTRQVPFTKEIYIERGDFELEPPKKFFRLKPDGEVRLRSAYVIKCDEVIQGPDGKVSELKCSIDYDTLGKKPEGRKVKGVIHWVSASKGQPIAVHLYDRLFNKEFPLKEDNWQDCLNPDSLQVVAGAVIEPFAAAHPDIRHYQFERLGYFYRDGETDGQFNRTVTLRDTWNSAKKG